MADGFSEARLLEGERVRMRFQDGHEVTALLFSATTDMDGTRHLVYGDVEASSEQGSYDGSANTCYYADGKDLLSIERAGDETKS